MWRPAKRLPSGGQEAASQARSVVHLDVAPVSIAVANRHMSQNVLVTRVADGQVGHPGEVAHDALHGNDMLRAKVVGEVAEVRNGKKNICTG